MGFRLSMRHMITAWPVFAGMVAKAVRQHELDNCINGDHDIVLGLHSPANLQLPLVAADSNGNTVDR